MAAIMRLVQVGFSSICPRVRAVGDETETFDQMEGDSCRCTLDHLAAIRFEADSLLWFPKLRKP